MQARELRNKLDTIREGLKQMKGRVLHIQESLDVPEREHTPSLPLEPHERNVRKCTSTIRKCVRALCLLRLQELRYAEAAEGLRDVTGVEKLLQMHANELQVTRFPTACTSIPRSNVQADPFWCSPLQREKIEAAERLSAQETHAHVQQQQIRASLEDENVSLSGRDLFNYGLCEFHACALQRRGLGTMQEQLEGLQRDVQAMQQRLQQQQEYCSSHHVYDTTSPLITEDMILQAPASAADDATFGLIDMAQQVGHRTRACSAHPVTGLRLTLLQIQRGVAGMSLTEPLGVTGVSLAMPLGVAGKREEELLQRQLSIVQQLLNQLASGAHDLSTCVQRAAHLKCHPIVNHA